MATARGRISSHDRASSGSISYRGAGGVVVGPILNAGKLKSLLLADGNSTRKCKILDLSHCNIRKVALSLGEVAALDFECLTDLDLHGNLLVSLDGHSLPFPHLQNLRASNCRINNLTNFGSHFRLRQLDLSGNQLTHIMGLANTPLRFTLQALRLANNHIRDFKGLAPLSTFESLETLDLTQNPLLDFGLVAEGFALLCCPTLRQLNGRAVSEEVRDVVDTWAADDMCGRATAATVEAFRDALLHPEGPSLLATPSNPPRIGRVSRLARSEDATSSFSSTGHRLSSVAGDPQLDLGGSESSVTENQSRRKNAQQYDCASSVMSSESRQESRAAATRASSNEVQTAADGPPLAQPVNACSLGRDKRSTAADDTFQDDSELGKAEERCASFTAQSNLKEHADCAEEDLGCSAGEGVTLRPGASFGLLGRKARARSTVADAYASSSGSCELCSCSPVPHGQYYHSRDQQRCTVRDHTANRASSQRRIFFTNNNSVRCCTGTQTPAGWMHPLDLATSSRSVSSGSAKEDGTEVGSDTSSAGPPPDSACDLPRTDSNHGQETGIDSNHEQESRTDSSQGQNTSATSGVENELSDEAEPRASVITTIESEQEVGGDDQGSKSYEGTDASAAEDI